MGKQRTEKRFRESLQHAAEVHGTSLWYIKLQVNQLAHNSNPGDFLVFLDRELHCIEAKQVTGKNRFSFKRLSQKSKLTEFDLKPNQHGWVLISFWFGSAKKSDTFLLTVAEYEQLISSTTKVSIRIDEIVALFPNSRVQLCCRSTWAIVSRLQSCATPHE